MPSSKIHFVNIDWVIYFPGSGNEGRPYPRYGVAYRDRLRGLSQGGRRVYLGDVMALPKIRDNYPHIVAHFTDTSGKGDHWAPHHLEKREVRSEEEFYSFLRERGI